MTSSSPKTVNPLNYNFPNRLSFPLNRLNPAFSYDQAYLNELKVLNNVPLDDSPFLSLFESDNEYYTNNLLPRRSIENPNSKSLGQLNNGFAKLNFNNNNNNNNDKDKKNKTKQPAKNTLPKINKRREDNSFENDDSDQYYVNHDGRLTSFRSHNPNQNYNNYPNPLKNPSVHDYLYSLASKNEHEGYVEKYQEIKQKRSREVPKPAESIKEFKRFKENAGFGFNFLDPTRSKELTEVKIEKVNKRNKYSTYVKERNLANFGKKNTYDPEVYINMNSLPNLQYSRYVQESKKTR